MKIHQGINDMNRQLLFVLAGIVLFLGGCSLAPKYTQPQAPIPAQWPQGAAYKDRGATPGLPTVQELKWEDFFADKQLQKIIETALSNNRDLRLAALNVERARALYGIQRAELFPAVNAVGTGGKQRLSSDLIKPGDPRTIEQYSINMGIAS
jgi:multidrug efflux system outer membrane protein